MTLDKAIETLNYFSTDPNGFHFPALVEALKLGTEALKQVKESRFDPSTWTPQILPGETKD